MKFDHDFRSEYGLRDGRIVELRLVRPGDEGAFVLGLASCSARTIYNRFLGAKPKFSDSELHYLTHCPVEHHVGLVGFLEGELVAVGRAIRYIRRTDAADFGLIVRDDLQGQGLGKHLIGLLTEAMNERGISYLCGEMFATNSAMFRVIDDLPYVTDWVLEGPTATFEVDLSSPKQG